MEGEDGTPMGIDEVCIAIRSANAGAAMGFSCASSENETIMRRSGNGVERAHRSACRVRPTNVRFRPKTDISDVFIMVRDDKLLREG